MAKPPKPEDPNKHVLEYLRYYCKPEHAFDYAVMLNGPWGCGKTHFIKQFIKERREDTSTKTLYVSLYGIKSFGQIDNAILGQLHPVLASEGMQVAGRFLKEALKATLKVDMDLKASDIAKYLKIPRGSLLIFDDLERCSIKLSNVLGYINRFVEHQGLKVIILANEDEIKKRKRYIEIKEKLIGQTLRVHSTAVSALPAFLDLVQDKRTREFLEAMKDVILLLHSQTERHNLRILKQALWDFERLSVCFSKKHWAKVEAIEILLQLVLPLSFEIRAGLLKERELAELKVSKYMRSFGEDKKKEPSCITKLENRYPQTFFDQTLISAETLKALLFDGKSDPEVVQLELDKSSYYASPDSIPAWRVAWNLWHNDDATFEKAVKDVEAQFKQREFVIPGEVLHIFGLRLFFAELGAIKQTQPEIVLECKEYVDHLRKSGTIEDAYTSNLRFERNRSWDGLGYMNYESLAFQEILKYYNKQVDEAGVASLPKIGLQLLKVLERSPTKYYQALCVNNIEPPPYCIAPVLAAIPPKTFVDHVLGANVEAQRGAFAVFRARYQTGELNNHLKAEKAWLKDVKLLFEKRADKLRPLSKARIINDVKHSIDPLLK